MDAGKALRVVADATLPLPGRAVLADLSMFVTHRLDAADQLRERIAGLVSSGASGQTIQPEIHAFLRECWDVLDGLGRQINICLYGLFPDAGLQPPERMTRQCTFYTVRRALRRHEDACGHPLCDLLWSETRARAAPAYVRMSFLYNLSVFVPVPLPEGVRLPSAADVPVHVRGLIRTSDTGTCSIGDGLDEMLGWLRGFVERCYARMVDALREQSPGSV